MSFARKAAKVAKQIVLPILIFCMIVVVISLAANFMADEMRMQGAAVVWVAEQELVEYTVQPGDSWDKILADAPDYIWGFELARELRAENKDRGYVSWTGGIHKTLITNSLMLVPASFAEAQHSEVR